MKFVDMLLHHDIKPILVFDGRNLPSKAATEAKRRENRTKYRKMAREYLQVCFRHIFLSRCYFLNSACVNHFRICMGFSVKEQFPKP